MKYAVAYNVKRPYLIVQKHNTRKGAEDELRRQGIKEGSRNDVRIIRILSHEEAKRKAAAVALLKHAEWCRANKQGTWSSVANAEAEAEKLWPALFHAGDGKLPQNKKRRRG